MNFKVGSFPVPKWWVITGPVFSRPLTGWCISYFLVGIIGTDHNTGQHTFVQMKKKKLRKEKESDQWFI